MLCIRCVDDIGKAKMITNCGSAVLLHATDDEASRTGDRVFERSASWRISPGYRPLVPFR